MDNPVKGVKVFTKISLVVDNPVKNVKVVTKISLIVDNPVNYLDSYLCSPSFHLAGEK